MLLPKNISRVHSQDNFLFFTDNKGMDKEPRLIVDVSRTESIVSYMKEKNLKTIMINSVYFPVNDLNFLNLFPFVERIFITDNNHDITPINELPYLREIRMGAHRGTIDFNNFVQLEKLGIEWSNRLRNLENATNIGWLWLNTYKGNSLEEFTNFRKLTYIYLYRPSIKSLKGIENMYSLNDLNIDTASKLESLEGLNENLNHLESLYIYAAKQLNNYEPISKLVALKHLELRKTGEANSIDFIKGLIHLEKIVFGFKILDGNMSYLKGIKDVGFIDFPHYSNKMKDFKQSVGLQNS